MFRFATHAVVAFGALLLLVACGTRDAPKIDLVAKAAADSAAKELAPDAKVALDSGNVLFRQQNYTGARRQYEVAAQRSPAHAAPLFGLYMVGRATNDRALADSAMAGIRARNAVPPHDLRDSSALPQRPTSSRGAVS